MRAALLTTSIAGLAALTAAAVVVAERSGSGHRGSAITVIQGGAHETVREPAVRTTSSATARPRTRAVTPAAAMAARATWWKPDVSNTWQWQLTGKINIGYDVDVYDIDLFEAPDATIAALHRRGRRIICYFSAGSAEPYRPDFDQFRESDLGKPIDGFEDERWVDIRSDNVRRIMRKRLDLAAARGCDGVEPDNVDGYANRNGLDLTADQQLDYNRFLADQSHRRGLAVGLKNDLGQVRTLVDSFDYAINEQCNQYNECGRLRPFTAARKPIFNAEYKAKYRDNVDGARVALCKASRAADIRTLVLPLALDDAFRYSCG